MIKIHASIILCQVYLSHLLKERQSTLDMFNVIAIVGKSNLHGTEFLLMRYKLKLLP